jgi:hypothetical protein
MAVTDHPWPQGHQVVWATLSVCRHTPCCRRVPLRAIRVLAVRQALTFAGVPDTLALVPAPPFRGFFVLPAAPEFPEQPGVLQLPLQSTQGKLHIIVMHRDSQHNLPSKTPGREVCPAPARDPRSAFMVHSSDLHGTRGRHGSLLETVQRAGCHGRQRGVRARRLRRGQPRASTTAVRPLHHADRPRRDAARHAAGLH